MMKAGLFCFHCDREGETVECFICGKPTCVDCRSDRPATRAGKGLMCTRCANNQHDFLEVQQEIYKRHGRSRREKSRLHRQQHFRPGAYARMKGK